nr:MAG TPA: hypothetical protein [Caudoviricetes sp.]
MYLIIFVCVVFAIADGIDMEKLNEFLNKD